jgi:hypothetical protein
MSTLTSDPVAKRVTFSQDSMWVQLADGRMLGVPLEYFPRLSDATAAQRKRCTISASGKGLHWEALDEDISVKGLLEGVGDMTKLGRSRRFATKHRGGGTAGSVRRRVAK